MKIAAVLGLLLFVFTAGSVAAQSTTDSMEMGVKVIDTSTEVPTPTPTFPGPTPTPTSTDVAPTPTSTGTTPANPDDKGTPAVAKLPNTGSGAQPESGGPMSFALMVTAGVPVLAGAVLMLRTRERGGA